MLGENSAKVLDHVVDRLVPAVPVSTAEWAQENLVLPPETGAFQREFSLEYGPHLYGIFAAFDDDSIEEVYCMKAAQVLWTTALLAYIFKRICRSPCVILGMFASEGAAKKFGLTKASPIGAATPEVAKRIDFSTSRKKGNTIQRKEFDGGFLEMFGSNSVSNVKSTTAHFVFVEEPDDANDNIDSQGDSIKLLFERTKRVRKPKKILGGTPSVKGFSRVAEYIELSDKRELPIKCHECGQKHVLDFDYLSCWQAEPGEEEDAHPVYGYHHPENTLYVCPNCGCTWDDYRRKENIRITVADAIADGDPLCGWEITVPNRAVAGFTRLNELYSCLPGAGHVGLIRDYLEAEHYAQMGDNTKKIVFINSKRGEAYEYVDGSIDTEVLRDSGEDYSELIVPRGGLELTLTVDVQPDRLAVVIRAWGRGEESWLVYWGELAAKVGVTDINDPVWGELDRLLFGAYRHEDGYTLRILAAAIDSGDGNTNDAVYHYVRTRRGRGSKLMAIKGGSVIDQEIVRTPKKIDVDSASKASRFGLEVWIVGVNRAKDLISSRLKLTGSGPGRMHFYNEVRGDYADQMTSEAKIPSRRQRNKKIWTRKSGRQSEAWDCEVYALFCAKQQRLHIRKPGRWDDIEAKLKQGDLLSSAPDQDVIKIVGGRPERPEEKDSPLEARVALKNNPARSMVDLGRKMGGR